MEGYDVDYSNLPLGHGEKSVILVLCSGIELTDAEMLAIRWHMGGFDMRAKSGSSTYANAFYKFPVACLFHVADTLTTYLDETVSK